MSISSKLESGYSSYQRESFCTRLNQIASASIQRINRFTKSLFGKMTLSYFSELGGAFIGESAGRAIGNWAAEGASPIIFGKHSVITPILVPVCETAGSFLGTLIGGYGGAKLVNHQTKFWSEENPQESYGISATRFILAGKFFDAAIVTPAHPFIHLIVAIPRRITKTIFQTSAFYSHKVIPLIQEMFVKRKPTDKVIFSFAIETIVKKYCIHQVDEIKKNLTNRVKNLISPPPIISLCLSFLLPQFKAGLKCIAAISTMDQIPKIKEKIDIIVDFFTSSFNIANNLPIKKNLTSIVDTAAIEINFTTALLIRSLHEYIKKIENSETVQDAQIAYLQAPMDKREDAKKRFQEVLEKELEISWILQIGKNIVLTQLENILPSLFEKLKNEEIKWAGFRLLSNKSIEEISQIIPIYLQTYLLFTIANCSEFKKELSPKEEYEFFQDLNYLLFSGYVHYIINPALSKKLKTIFQTSISAIYFFKRSVSRFLLSPEQESYIASPPQFVGDYFESEESKEPECSAQLIREAADEKKKEETVAPTDEDFVEIGDFDPITNASFILDDYTPDLYKKIN